MSGRCDPNIVDALLDYAQGALDAEMRREVSRHLEQCPECRARLREMIMFHSLFSSVEKSVWGDKGPCPDPEELALLSETPSLLDKERIKFIKKHLSECVRCSDEFRRLAGITKSVQSPNFVKTYPVPQRLMARISRIVSDRVKSGAAAGEPAVIALDKPPLFATYTAVRDATGRDVPQHQDNVPVFGGPLTGRLLSLKGDPLRGEWISLLRNNVPYYRIRTGKLGEFYFSGLRQGFYELAARDARLLVVFFDEVAKS